MKRITNWCLSINSVFRHAGLEEPAPYLIRGHPDVVPTKVGNHLKDWVPVFTGNPGFPLEFIPMKIGAGMTILIEGAIYKQTLIVWYCSVLFVIIRYHSPNSL